MPLSPISAQATRPLNYLSVSLAEPPIPGRRYLPTSVTIDTQKPILFVDVDGVISLFGFSSSTMDFPGPFHWVDGIAHCIPEAAGARLEQLAERFELVWATGWEEKANEYLPFILKLPFDELPVLTFGGRAVFGSSHWKLEAMEEYAGSRAAAWIDDNIDEDCEAWAERREAPTLLVHTKPPLGMTDEHVDKLLRWADEAKDLAGSQQSDRPAEPTPPPPAEARAGSRFAIRRRRARS